MKPTIDVTLSSYSPQQILDAVVRHAKTQTSHSKRDNQFGDTRCVYRTPDLQKACFIGCLLTDEEALKLDASSYGTGIRVVMRDGRVPARLADQNPYFLGALQSVHDQNRPEQWLPQLAAIAKEYGLTFKSEPAQS